VTSTYTIEKKSGMGSKTVLVNKPKKKKLKECNVLTINTLDFS
jgi:hypothetical protein